ncbi:esterase lipase [Levilactobacillus senmaizukei DSM 21775 = NBRC 103853]|uniref:Esterase lipase n=1 Tax=Levilactobacillus senmaizukei DSM 21775 = NBRC 103853 TaxID=1423803 RepID=A0A0R2DIC1_9LACO|nr:alpha/beta hydrolase [Levilactobacillus senmaizukei]KRN03155.1 esterase lipase [Levilactobacillus senmaizukei DSM 21775 = NBRC 103853]
MEIITKKLAADSSAYLKGYLRANETHKAYPAIIIVPGGSYTHIPEQQAEDLAMAWFSQGYQAFYLRYSFVGEVTPLLPTPMIELAKSMALLKANAADWQLNDRQIAVAGFSVGGHIAALFNDRWAQPAFNQSAGTTPDQIKPQAVILGYPVITPAAGFPNDLQVLADWTNDPATIAADQLVTDDNVPTFIWGTSADPLVPVQNALAYAQASLAHQVDTDLHLFHHGPHGLALANDVTAWKTGTALPHVAHWLSLAHEWLKELPEA